MNRDKSILKFQVPLDFDEYLRQFTMGGLRVIALAGKYLDPDTTHFEALRLPRHVIESHLHLYGFLIMQNPIKTETNNAIKELTTANIICVMVTGMHLN